MAETYGHHDHSRHNILLDVATPQLYRANAFRVLGLSVVVDGTEMSRQMKKLKMLEKLGGTAPQGQVGVLPLNPPPDSDTIRRAGQRLHDMQLRLVDELFWFWPLEGAAGTDGDTGFELLSRGDVSGAHQRWSEIAKDNHRWFKANHNLAVLNHAMALDIEYVAETQSELLGSSILTLRDKYWHAALKHWASTAADEALWAYIASRASALDDPRLTSGLVRRLRSALPAAILRINVHFAVRAAKVGDKAGAKRHGGYLRTSGFELGIAARMIEQELSPLIDQLHRICDPIPAQSQDAPHAADALARQAIRDCEPLLQCIGTLCGKQHHLRQIACDLVAGTVRSCMIDYGNETDDWGQCIPLLEHAAGLALDEGLRSCLQDDVAHVKKNHAEEQRVEELKKAVTGDRVYEVVVDGGQARIANVCTCCLGPPNGEQTVSHEWEEARGGSRYKRTLSFNFPVCEACQHHQSEYLWKRTVLVLLSAGISIVIAFIAGEIQKPEWLHFVIVGGFFTVVLAFLLSAMTWFRLRVLPEQHACRDQAVEMPDAADGYVVFRFHNPLYAETFARSNGVTVRERQMRKPTRGSFILAGRGAVLSIIVAIVLGGIGQSIIYAVREDDWHRISRTPTRSSPSSPTRTYSTPRPPTPKPTRAYTGLSSKIDSGKVLARTLETELDRMDSEIKLLSASLGRYKREVEGYESQVRQGVRVNEYLYQGAIDKHNRLVEQYNSLLADRKLKYDKYQRELNSVNDMVRRYNRGER